MDEIMKAAAAVTAQAAKDLGFEPRYGDLTADHDEFVTGKVGWLGLGIIEWKADSDQHNNQVSLIMMPDATKYRMVHHRSQGYYEYATIYAGRNKFMRFKYREGKRDTELDVIELGRYSMAWGDGDPGFFENHPDGPNLNEIFGKLYQSTNGKSLFILNVLLHAGPIAACWDSK